MLEADLDLTGYTLESESSLRKTKIDKVFVLGDRFSFTNTGRDVLNAEDKLGNSATLIFSSDITKGFCARCLCLYPVVIRTLSKSYRVEFRCLTKYLDFRYSEETGRLLCFSNFTGTGGGTVQSIFSAEEFYNKLDNVLIPRKNRLQTILNMGGDVNWREGFNDWWK